MFVFACDNLEIKNIRSIFFRHRLYLKVKLRILSQIIINLTVKKNETFFENNFSYLSRNFQGTFLKNSRKLISHAIIVDFDYQCSIIENKNFSGYCFWQLSVCYYTEMFFDFYFHNAN